MLSIFAIVTILLTSTSVPNFVAFADDDKKDKLTKLQEECSKVPKNPQKIKPECELLDIINSLQEEQAAKNAELDTLIVQLQTKDSDLMATDADLHEKDSALMAEDNAIKKRVNVNSRLAGAVCDNVPLLRDALGLISQTTSAVIASIVSIGDFKFAASVPGTSFSTGNIIPTVSLKKSSFNPCDDVGIGSCGIHYGSGLSFGTTSKTITIPNLSFDLGNPFAGFISVLQTSNVLPAADAVVTNILDCDPDGLNDIDVPLQTT